mgnify:CR=1 FL=1
MEGATILITIVVVAKFNTIPIKILVSIRIIQVFVVAWARRFVVVAPRLISSTVSSVFVVSICKSKFIASTALTTTINAIFVRVVVCVTVVHISHGAWTTRTIASLITIFYILTVLSR